MDKDIMIAVIALLGTVVGSGGGVLVSSKLTNYRICQLEKKVEKHNQVVERTYILEEKMKVANHRIDDLESRD